LRERSAGFQRVGGPGHRVDVLQVLLFQRGVEQVAGVFPALAEDGGERLADRDAGTPAGVIDRPKRQLEGSERGVEPGGNASPRVNEGVVPVVQKSSRAGNGRLLAAAARAFRLPGGSRPCSKRRGAGWTRTAPSPPAEPPPAEGLRCSALRPSPYVAWATCWRMALIRESISLLLCAKYDA
jgi:hypothetical protein